LLFIVGILLGILFSFLLSRLGVLLWVGVPLTVAMSGLGFRAWAKVDDDGQMVIRAFVIIAAISTAVLGFGFLYYWWYWSSSFSVALLEWYVDWRSTLVGFAAVVGFWMVFVPAIIYIAGWVERGVQRRLRAVAGVSLTILIAATLLNLARRL
jgi:hypothetical protein